MGPWVRPAAGTDQAGHEPCPAAGVITLYRVCRWLVLDISMPSLFRPLRRLILSGFDKENLRTMAAVKKYAETHSGG